MIGWVLRWTGLVCLAALLGFMFGGLRRPVSAQTYIADTAASPSISLTPDALLHFWSNQALSNGVMTDGQWNTAMAQLFSAANWPGVNATSLAFLRSFFVQYVHVGGP